MTHRAMPDYFEEVSSLSEDTALCIMQDETCMVLPSMKTIIAQTDEENEYILVLRNLANHQEYMHPDAVTSLNNWHCFFLDCPLMKGLDFVSQSFKFPEISSPPSRDSNAVLTRTFQLQGRTFRLSVTHAPPSLDSSVIFYALTTQDLPVQHEIYENILHTSARRKACLQQYAALAMMEGKGLQAVSAAKGLPEGDEHLIQQLSLEHGPRVLQGVGTKSYQVSGWFEMHEREHTAASCSLPLLLKHLHFLQFTLRGPIQYHIKAPNKYAYMVWLKNVGGLEIYYQVNMNASLAAMQNAFSSSPASNTVIVYPTRASQRTQTTSVLGMMQQTLLLEAIQTRMQSIGTQNQSENMSEEEFVDYMKYNGLDILRKAVTDIALQQKRILDTQSAKKVLEALLNSSAGNLSRETYLKTACMVFMGIVNDVWENLKETDEEKKPSVLIRLLNQEIKDTHFLRLKDIGFMPTLLRGCLDCNPYKWWERFVTLCEIQGPNRGSIQESEKSAYLCASILFHWSKYSGLFSSSSKTLLMAQNEDGDWAKMIESACVADNELGNLKEAYESLSNAKGSSSLFKTGENARKLYYVRAISYMMLIGDKHVSDLKTY